MEQIYNLDFVWLCCLIAAFSSSGGSSVKNQSVPRKPLLDRLEEKRQRAIRQTYATRRELWRVIKEKRRGESEEHWKKRLRFYGFSEDGIYRRTGENFETEQDREKIIMYDSIYEKLKRLEGEIFHTVKGLPFTYRFVDDSMIQTSRTTFKIHIANFEKALNVKFKNICELEKAGVFGPSYVFAIITDSRF